MRGGKLEIKQMKKEEWIRQQGHILIVFMSRLSNCETKLISQFESYQGVDLAAK